MDKRLLIYILGIAAAIFLFGISDLIALGILIYLVWMVWKQKINVFNQPQGPNAVKRHFRKLKALLIVAGFSFLVLIAGTIGHNVISGLIGREETFYFIFAIVAHLVFVVATTGGLVIFLKGRGKIE